MLNPVYPLEFAYDTMDAPKQFSLYDQLKATEYKELEELRLEEQRKKEHRIAKEREREQEREQEEKQKQQGKGKGEEKEKKKEKKKKKKKGVKNTFSDTDVPHVAQEKPLHFDLDITQHTRHLIQEEKWPFFQFHVLNTRNATCTTRYVPRLHKIDDNVVHFEYMKHPEKYLSPDKEAATLSVREKEIRNMERFVEDPLYYMALKPEFAYGITVLELERASERFCFALENKKDEQTNNDNDNDDNNDDNNNNNNNNDNDNDNDNDNNKKKKRKSRGVISPQKLRNYMEAVVRDIQRICSVKETGKLLPIYTIDAIFPKTKTKTRRRESNKYHKACFQYKVTRVIPVYILPFLFRVCVRNEYLASQMKEIDYFTERLRKFYEKHTELSCYDVAYFQLRANTPHVFKLTQETVMTERHDYGVCKKSHKRTRTSCSRNRYRIQNLKAENKVMKKKITDMQETMDQRMETMDQKMETMEKIIQNTNQKRKEPDMQSGHKIHRKKSKIAEEIV